MALCEFRLAWLTSEFQGSQDYVETTPKSLWPEFYACGLLKVERENQPYNPTPHKCQGRHLNITHTIARIKNEV